MVNEEGNLIIPNITEGEYASREGVNYYCIASDNIGYSVAVRSRNVTVYYACELPCIAGYAASLYMAAIFCMHPRTITGAVYKYQKYNSIRMNQS